MNLMSLNLNLNYRLLPKHNLFKNKLPENKRKKNHFIIFL